MEDQKCRKRIWKIWSKKREVTALFASVLTIEELMEFPTSVAGGNSKRSLDDLSDIGALMVEILEQINKINKSYWLEQASIHPCTLEEFLYAIIDVLTGQVQPGTWAPAAEESEGQRYQEFFRRTSEEI